MNYTLRVWRQPNGDADGKLVDYPANDIPEGRLLPRNARTS